MPNPIHESKGVESSPNPPNQPVGRPHDGSSILEILRWAAQNPGGAEALTEAARVARGGVDWPGGVAPDKSLANPGQLPDGHIFVARRE